MQDFSEWSDRQLTIEIRKSSQRAFKALYLRYFDAIYRYIAHRLYSGEDTQDFVQEVFTRLWQHRHDLDPKKSIKAYLYRVSYNLVIDHLRKRGSDKIFREYITLSNSSPESTMDDRMTLKEAINDLPENVRLVFKMSRYDGLKYKEIADICQISIKTVESRMTQAFKLLRKELAASFVN
ncbi:RNA polymerase sigma-70 factor [bacterium]|nr:RNA polymerase sigma-70 factor [bacterium]